MSYNDSELQMNSQLILCIKEHDTNHSVDTILFIGWSHIDNVYYMRGKRQDICDKNFVPYAFHSENDYDLSSFVEFVIGTKKTSSIILYNFNNINEMNCNDITYDFLEEHIDINYEIAGYDNVKVRRLELVKYLRMLKNI